MVLTSSRVQHRSVWPSTAPWLLPPGHQDSPCPPNSLQHDRCGAHPAHSCYDPPAILHVGNISLAPEVDCRPVLNSQGYTPGTEQEEQHKKRMVEDQYDFDFEKRRKPLQMKWEDPCWVVRWHNLPTWRASISGCCPELNTPLAQGTGQRKVFKTAFKSSNFRVSMPSCPPEVTESKELK